MLPSEMVAKARIAGFRFKGFATWNVLVSRNSVSYLTYSQNLQMARLSVALLKKYRMSRVESFDDFDVSRRGSVEVADGATEPSGSVLDICAGIVSLESGGLATAMGV